jgi:iron(III) transport system substrate-binding protein
MSLTAAVRRPTRVPRPRCPILPLRALVVGLLASLMISGCGDEAPADDQALPDYIPEAGGGWDDVIAAAQDEGSVVWYTVAPQASVDALVAAFESEFPEIEVDARRMGSAEMDSALAVERSTGAEGADIVTSVNYPVVYERQADDWYVDLKGPHVATDWAGTEYLDDGQILSSPLGIIVLGWNTQLFPDGLEDYEDLKNADLGEGAIGLVRPDAPITADWWAFVEVEVDPDFAPAMAAQDPALYPSAAAIEEALTAGEIAVGSFVSATDMEELRADGAPVEYVVPDKSWTAQNLFFIPTSATNSNAAQVFMDFFASPTGQLAAARYGYSPVEEVRDETLGGESEIVLTNLERVTDTAWFESYLTEWKTTFGE